MFHCSFTIESNTRYLAPLRQWVGAVARIVGGRRFPARAVMACSLALVEAVDNAIYHAHRRKRHLPIRVSLRLDRRDIVLEVADSGGGIGHPRTPRPDAMVSHGRGLFLIRQVMNSVESRLEDGRHRMKMVYRL